MKQEEYENELANILYSDRPILYIPCSDFLMTIADVKNAVDKLGYNYDSTDELDVLEFDSAIGETCFKTGRKVENGGTSDLKDFLRVCTEPDNADWKIVVLKDIDLSEAGIASQIRFLGEYIVRENKKRKDKKTLVILNAQLTVSCSIEKMTTVLIPPLPDEEEIKKILSDFYEKDNRNFATNCCPGEEGWERLVMSLKGMDRCGINEVLSDLIILGGGIGSEEVPVILNEKKHIVEKSSVLEVIDSKFDWTNVAGLGALKKYLENKAKIMNKGTEALKAGVTIPKGILICGAPGCGKSLCAKACANLFHDAPLLRLDMGRLMGKYVGESEHNFQKAIATAEAAHPCVLWIDEIEKAFVGAGGTGGVSDSTTTRLLGSFLTWMQENKSWVYIVATANDTTILKPEFLRKGRFDEVFFVDYPSKEERVAILKVLFEKQTKDAKNVKSKEIDYEEVANATEGYSGSELECVINSVIEDNFIKMIDEKESEITTKMFLDQIKKQGKPLSAGLNPDTKRTYDDLKKKYKSAS